MSINEKDKPLEFTFVPDGLQADADPDRYSVNITYDKNNVNRVFPVTLRQGGQEIQCPIEMFVEIVGFLRAKGLCGSLVAMPQMPITSGGTQIPVPEIDGVQGEIEGEESGVPLIDVEPLTSFNTSAAEPEIDEGISDIPEPISSKVVVGGKEVSEEPSIKRPVIRTTRTDASDPLQLEKQSAAMRGDSGKGVVKRRED